MTKTVVIQTAWLGDVVLTTPLLEALATRHGPVDVVTTPAAAPLVATHPAVSRVHAYDKHGTDRGVVGLRRVAATLRRERYETAVHPQSSWRSALLAWSAGIPRRIGFADAPARMLYTRRVPRGGAHEADRLLGLAGGRGPSTLSLYLLERDHLEAARLLALHGIEPPFAVLAPHSARPTKRWPYYQELAETLAQSMDVVIVGPAVEGSRGWDDRARVFVPTPPSDPTARSPRGARADLSGLPVRTSAAVMARAAIAVTNDSAPLHMAEAMGTPVVAVFGPTTAELGFGPRGPNAEVVEREGLGCRPCSTHGGARCPLTHHRCLRDLPVGAVRDAVERVLTRAGVPCA